MVMCMSIYTCIFNDLMHTGMKQDVEYSDTKQNNIWLSLFLYKEEVHAIYSSLSCHAFLNNKSGMQR